MQYYDALQVNPKKINPPRGTVQTNLTATDIFLSYIFPNPSVMRNVLFILVSFDWVIKIVQINSRNIRSPYLSFFLINMSMEFGPSSLITWKHITCYARVIVTMTKYLRSLYTQRSNTVQVTNTTRNYVRIPTERAVPPRSNIA